jgi:hypothetical protein
VKVCIDLNGQVVFFTPMGKTLLGAPPAQPGFGKLDGDTALGGGRGEGIEETGRETVPHPAGAPVYKHDRHIPWEVEARAWEALESG